MLVPMSGPSTPPPPTMSVYLQVLGPVRVLVGDTDVSVGGPIPRTLVARLAVAGGETVTDDALVDELWGENPPPSARQTLQGYVARIRKVLDPHRTGAQSRVLVRRGNGYALEPDATDWQQFTALAGLGRNLLTRGEFAAAAETLDTALDHWRGDAYADVPESGTVTVEARRLDALRTDATEDRLEAALEIGEHAWAAAQLDALTRIHPLRERAWELLARAHYLAGRPGDALDALRRAREVLAEELGTDPRPSLLALHSAILAHDDHLLRPTQAAETPAPEPEPGPVPARPADPFAHNIPLALTPLVGRRTQLADLTRLLERHRLVTLTGPGGMGKTRLALESARTRADVDGPWLVELAGATDVDQVADALATSLGLTVPGGVDGITDVLRGRDTLLVLDNCEQAVAPVAEVVTAILTRCPGIRVLATSREALFAAGEFAYEIPPLDNGDDVALFVARAAAQLGVFEPDDDELAMLTQLCTELDGMPLAIELAAAQCRTLSVRQLSALVDDRFALLRGGPRTNARHTTMLAAVEWSYQTLTEPEQRLFQSLAVFEGGFDLDSADAVVGDAALLTNLTSLVDKSLVSVVGGDPRRYRMLETMRGYATLVREPDLTVALRRAHTDWVCDLADAAFTGLRGRDSSRWMRRMELEIANVRAALAFCDDDVDTYLRIAGGVYWYWYRGGHVAEAIRWLSPAMTPRGGTASQAALPVHARAVAGAVVIHYLAGDLPGVFTAFGLLTDLAADLTDPAARADAESTLAFFEAGSGLVDQARAHAAASLDFGRRSGRAFTAAEALMCLGTADFRAGDFDSAATHLDESVAVAAGCGYGWCEASALWIGAKVDLAQGRHGGPAEAKLARMVRVCVDNDDVTSWLVAVATLACAALRRGDLDQAALLTGVVDRRGAAIGYRPASMDPVDLAGYDNEIRATLSPAALADGRDRGGVLGRDEVTALVAPIPA